VISLRQGPEQSLVLHLFWRPVSQAPRSELRLALPPPHRKFAEAACTETFALHCMPQFCGTVADSSNLLKVRGSTERLF
jgi:hypothetical protein